MPLGLRTSLSYLDAGPWPPAANLAVGPLAIQLQVSDGHYSANTPTIL